MKTLIIFIKDPIECASDVQYAVLDGAHAAEYHDKWLNTTDLSEQDEANLNAIGELATPERPALDGQYEIAICGFYK